MYRFISNREVFSKIHASGKYISTLMLKHEKCMIAYFYCCKTLDGVPHTTSRGDTWLRQSSISSTHYLICGL